MPVPNQKEMHVSVDLLNEDKKLIRNFGGACFAGLWDRIRKANATFIRYNIRIQTENQKIAERFFRFSLEHFPYFEVFEENNEQEIIKDGKDCSVLVDCRKHPIDKVFAALTHARYVDEYPLIVEVWDTFVKDGVDPEKAFIKAHIDYGSFGKLKYNLGGHALMYDGMVCKKDIDRFNPRTNEKFAKIFDGPPILEAPLEVGIYLYPKKGICSSFVKAFGFKGGNIYE